MPIFIFLFLNLFITNYPSRSLAIEDRDLNIEIVKSDLSEGQRDFPFRKLLVKEDGQIVDQILLKESNSGDYGYRIFDHYCDDRSCFVIIGSYNQFYLYDLQSFQISEVVEICQEKYCKLIDAQSCAIFNITFQNKGRKVSLDARDCKEIIFDVKTISF